MSCKYFLSKRGRQGKSFLKRHVFQQNKLLVFFLLALVGLTMAVSLRAGVAVALSSWKANPESVHINLALYSKDVPAERLFQLPDSNKLEDADPRQAKKIKHSVNNQGSSFSYEMSIPDVGAVSDLVQRGKELYQAGQFSEAVNVWQQAASTFEAQGDVLNRALVLSYLASTFQQLGQWTQANTAIGNAIALLEAQTLKPNPDKERILAQILNTQGHLQLAQGQESQALTTWQQAESAYDKSGDAVGVIGSQINQAKALQFLGLYQRAKATLEQVEQTLQKQPDSTLKVTGLRNLGNALRLVGDLNQSQQLLQQSLAVAEKLREAKPSSSDELSSEINATLLSLGNTSRAKGETDKALTFYRQAAAVSRNTTQIQALVNQLSLLVESERWTAAQTLVPQIQSQLAALPPSHLAIYAQINFAQSLMKLGSREWMLGNRGLLTPETIAQILATALKQAKNLSDLRAESYALGNLGTLYEQTQQWDNAKDLTQQALTLAQTINAPEIAYQWQWQLGRLLQAQGNVEQPGLGTAQSATKLRHESAIAAYTEAVKTLGSLRNDLVAINTDVQFSFRESVEPVYRQFVELLLQSPPGIEPSQKNLKQAREVIESLQLAELENFFRQACLTARPVNVDQVNSQTAIIYPIILPHQLAVILSLPNQPLSYYHTSLPQSEVERLLGRMRQSLRQISFAQERLPVAKQVYDLLLRSAEAKLAASGVTTLVFVLDGPLQNLPMAALHDGQHYLIEKYSIALAPGLQLLQPQPLKHQKLKGLLGGLSQPRQGFSALPGVASEVNQIKSELSAQVILDQKFTSTTVQSRINSAPFPVIHLATHGQFSSKAEDTFILTWDDRINVTQLDKVLRAREQGEINPIELLVLSACQTAAGDKRAALGLAGVAVRSGARSTIATLWSVKDQSTASLMVEFYHEIAQPGVTKAEALRRAQLSLLKQSEYAHPYYWSPFILLGNWL